MCLSTMVPVVSGRDSRLALVLGDDPTWRLTAGPILQFCKEDNIKKPLKGFEPSTF